MKVRVRVPIKLNIFVNDTVIPRKTDFLPMNLVRETTPLQQTKGMPISERNAQEHMGMALTALYNNCFREMERHCEKTPHVFQWDGCGAF